MNQKSILVLVCLQGALLPLFGIANVTPENWKVHPVELTDPVYPENPKREFELVIHTDSDGFPSTYTLHLVTGVCRDGSCLPVDLTLSWDAMGFYQSLEYPPDAPLTKLDHVPFTEQDYVLLDTILKDRSSVLIHYAPDYLLDSPNGESESEPVDGESSATPDTFRNAVIEGAAWTTWVLWHYANTEIFPIIREITETYCDPEYITYLMESGDWRKIEFALIYLLKQESVPDSFAKGLEDALATADQRQFDLALRYLERASANQVKFFQELIESENWKKIEFAHKRLLQKRPVPGIYGDRMLKLLQIADANQAVLVLDYLEAIWTDKAVLYKSLIRELPALEDFVVGVVIDRILSDKDLDKETLEMLSGTTGELSFYPIHLILRAIEGKNLESYQINEDIAKLLHHENFFIARRAYQFLSKRNLSEATVKELQDFRIQFAERL